MPCPRLHSGHVRQLRPESLRRSHPRQNTSIYTTGVCGRIALIAPRTLIPNGKHQHYLHKCVCLSQFADMAWPVDTRDHNNGYYRFQVQSGPMCPLLRAVQPLPHSVKHRGEGDVNAVCSCLGFLPESRVDQ